MPEVTLREIVDFIKPSGIIGEQEATVHRVDTIDIAFKGSLSFATEYLRDSDASVVICSKGVPKTGQTLILVDNPRLWFIRCMRHFFHPDDREPWIHPTAVINRPFVSLGKRVRIGPGSKIGFGGFAYERNEKGAYEKFPHRGRVIIGNDVDIGANTCIDRGSLDDTVIGDGTKIDNLVHIAHNVRIGKNCLIIALTCIGGGVIIEDGAYVGIGVSIRNHRKIGKEAFIGMGSVVVKDVDDYTLVYGVPARPKRKFSSARALEDVPPHTTVVVNLARRQENEV